MCQSENLWHIVVGILRRISPFKGLPLWVDLFFVPDFWSALEVKVVELVCYDRFEIGPMCSVCFADIGFRELFIRMKQPWPSLGHRMCSSDFFLIETNSLVLLEASPLSVIFSELFGQWIHLRSMPSSVPCHLDWMNHCLGNKVILIWRLLIMHYGGFIPM